MAGGGVGEAMLIGAAVGAGTGGVMSAVQDKDPLQGALLGAAMGAAGGGIGSAVGGAASGAATGAAGGGAGGGAGGVGGGVAGGEAGAATSTLTPAAAESLAFTGPNVGSSFAADQATQNIAQSAVSPNWATQGVGQGFAPHLTNAQAYGAGIAGAGMGAIGQTAQNQNNMAPEPETYTGPLSYFKYNPQTFRPSTAPGYAEGGIANLAVGGAQQSGMFPQSQMDKTQFATPSQMPISREIIGSDYDATISPYTGDLPRFADGGISSLGSYSDGGRMLRGPGDGMSDDIPGVIAGKQPARLADGEFVVPADVVSHLGNGSTDAGAKKLYSMMDNVRKARTGTKRQGKQIKADKYVPGMASGGVAYYDEGGDTSSDNAPVTKADLQAAIDSAKASSTGVATSFQPSGYTDAAQQYTPYTMANRPSSTEPQNYGNIYQGYYPDYSTPGYTLTGGNLGEWSNVAGEAQRAAQPASKSQQITQSYLQNLGRAPDQAGFDYWMGSGAPLSQIKQGIAQSEEAKNISGAGNVDRVSQMYMDLLGRKPDEAGAQFWQGALGQGATPEQVANQMKTSPEYQIRQMYQQYLGRAADPSGQDFWTKAAASGSTLDEIRKGIQGSEEAKAYAAKTQNKRGGGIAALRRA